jgi:predicted dehydrogenase
VIGCGHWGPNHIRVFSQLRESRVTAVCDLDARRRQAIHELFPEIDCLTEHSELLRRPDVDAVVVSIPTKAHYEVARAALDAGKHVLCEKPLCLRAAEAEKLTRLAESSSRVLMTGHVFLFNPGILKLKELISSDEPGRLYYLRALRTNLGPIRADVNSVYDLASHDISIFNFVLNATPLSASAVGGVFLQKGIEDLGFITLKYPDNVLASIQVSWLDPKKQREIVVVGEKKMIVWDDLAPVGPIHIYDKGVIREPYYDDYGQFHLLAREGDITIPRVRPEEPLKVQARFFLQAVREGSAKVSGGHFSLGVVKTLEAISASMRKGGAMVRVAG